ncbi:hypothetical protein R3P38DRAFT_3325358 [Favolaschia claudopus]|uniref:PIPK domain-containing protein n=1 Tax=Favolaschia claudopus TaxID=2862362 RepID=A0AAW0AED7_9AGAR
MADHKPLPEIPIPPVVPVVATPPNLTTLSVDAREHRARFIRHVLSEAEVDDGEDLWKATLEDALDSLSDAVTRGRWLAGLKRGHVTRRRDEEPQRSNLFLTRTDTMSSAASSLRSIVSSPVAFPEDPTVEALRQIRDLASQPALPNPKTESKHLLLCLAPLGSRIAVPNEDSGFDLIPANVGCVFKPSVYSLPEDDSDEPSSILYGLAEWDADTPDVKLVGGTFAFKGVTSPLQHHALSKALRISIYLHLSLLLEQHFFANSGVQLQFPRPKPRMSAVSYQPSVASTSPSSQGDVTPRSSRQSKTFLPGILSFFQKKNAGMPRTHTISTTSSTGARSGASFDLTSVSSRESSIPASPRLSEDGTGSRIRRFSFLGAAADSFLKPSPAPCPEPQDAAFTAILARLSSAASLLSSSTTVRFAPPPLIVDLAAKEAEHPGRRLLGDEKVGLGSILGWDARERDREARGKAMVGARGFARMQELSVLCSTHVPGEGMTGSTGTISAAGSTSTLGAGKEEEPHRTYAPCERPHWVTWQYYSRGKGDGGGSGVDRSVGEMVRRMCRCAALPCGRTGCTFKQGEHVVRLVHGGVRISVEVVAEGEQVEEAQEEKLKGSKELKKEKEKTKEKEKADSKKDVVKEKKEADVKEAETEQVAADSGTGSALSTATEKGTKNDAIDEERIEMWVSCAVCGKCSDRKKMNDGAYLFSYSKFLEVLIYSRAICTLTPALCSHTSPPLGIRVPPSAANSDAASPPLPSSRFNIIRHFASPALGYAVSFRLSTIDDVFELRVPRLQITRKSGDKGTNSARTSVATSASATSKDDTASVSTAASSATQAQAPVEEDKRALRREIKAWWEGVADHMDKLETTLVGSTLVGFRKALPRLPSVDDAYFDDSASEGGEDEDDDESELPTPKVARPPNSSDHLLISGLPPSAPTTPSIQRTAQELFPSPPRPAAMRASSDPVTPTPSAPASALASTSSEDSLELLANLRQNFHGAEQVLYTQLGQTPVSALNDVRRAFVAAAKGAEKRLAAWQKKHMILPGRGKSKRNREAQQKMEVSEPEWWGKGCHIGPGCNIIVREDDWGSIIAFTMSTTDYARELGSMSLVRAALSSPTVLTPSSQVSGSPSSFFSAKVAPSNYKQLFTSSSTPSSPDPDQDGVVWYEPEEYSAVISRKEHPRDVTSLLSLREVLRQKSPIDGISMLPGGSRFSSLGSAATKASSSGSGIVPPSAWSKPDVQISRHAVGGEVSSVDATAEEVGRILHEIEASSVEGAPASRPGSRLSESFLAGSMFTDIHVKRGKAGSIISVDSDSTVGGRSKEGSVVDDSENAKPKTKHEKDASTATVTAEPPSAPTPTPSSFTNTLTSGISSAMKLLLNNGEIPRPSMFSKNHHGLLTAATADPFSIDERPHIKYDWTVGKRLKFSCTIYYAKQFDNLRRRCGIEDVFVKSLSKSANWAAEGGKSKSNFWKTADDRFIIKTLVNAWNVADLQVLIELAPSYFRYMDATASKATVLAKLIGFYTIEIRNLETGNVQSKADLLVMENLFYDQKIVKTFDLKGIQGRKVKSSASGAAKDKDVRTLFDGEWIEGQQRTLTLVRPHSKVVLHEAIKSDADFLAKSNIMDYSLLLGVDQERKQIACGLVDTIGSYTFAKTLEYKAKQGLNSGNGKEVTVIPPTEYQDRFVSALEGYFLACPDKWSRSTDEHIKPINDPAMLPSVL